MTEGLGVELIQMMENAGSALADLVIHLYDPATAMVLAGTGGNGGGGLVAARHLAARGIQVSVALSRPTEELGGVTAHQARILQRMDVETLYTPEPAEVVIDAVIGYALVGAPRGRARDLIEWTYDIESPIVSLDTPSGLDLDTGEAVGSCARADATLTLAWPKAGLYLAPERVGRLFVADLSVPPSVLEQIGISWANLFADERIVELV